MHETAWSTVLSVSALIVNATTSSEVTYKDVIDKTMTIVRSCAMFDPKDTLLLAGEYDEFLQRSILGDLPVALMAESRSTAFELFALARYSFRLFKEISFAHLLWKIKRFVVIASSQPLLRLLLQRIRDSTWSNHNGYHVLIDRKTEDRGCLNAHSFLATAWEYDLLSTVFLCIDPDEGLAIYAYNPYSDDAPGIWKQAGRFKGPRGHPWVLLKTKYHDDPRMCEGLTFDRTSNLNGYVVRLNAIPFEPHLDVHPDKPGLDMFAGDNSEIVKILFGKLNATVDVLVYNGTESDLGGVGPDGNMMGLLADVGTGKVDMGMNARSFHAMWKVAHTFPHGQDGLCVLTQNLGEISEVGKIVSFMSPSVILGKATVSLITLMVLAKHEGFLRAFLNVARLLTYVAMHRLPQQTAYRIFFSTVFLVFIIICPLLQSHWAALLTVPVPRPNIMTLEDLKESNYQIYGPIYHMEQIHDSVLRSRFHGVSNDQCKERVLGSRNVACLGDCLHLYVGKSRNLHHSKRIQQNVQAYVTRENWALFNRVTEVISSIVEAGLVDMWRKLNTRKMYIAWQRKRQNHKKSFRILKMRHIAFGFHLLGYGYACATAAFLFELYRR
ncbi:uncharacterized protein LOC122397925 [Colletes gigas]|uniref:uncharacterized protein LOC122397925 n=1 Tax=Colletes gigas TaxID=935657 RepID=UPI001C9B8086|nr:uncharacterized protein LOC122397925 [Colletes gigas]